jgi:hypothetical protein
MLKENEMATQHCQEIRFIEYFTGNKNKMFRKSFRPPTLLVYILGLLQIPSHLKPNFPEKPKNKPPHDPKNPPKPNRQPLKEKISNYEQIPQKPPAWNPQMPTA